MLLTGRNTYKTRRVMLWYCVICLTCLMLFVVGLGASFIHPFWWVHALNVIFILGFFFTFFLLALENNNYNIKYYYSKKKFKTLYNKLILEYNVVSKKSKRRIKRIAKDYFYQFGKIDIMNSEVGTEIFSDWLNKHTYNHHLESKEERFDYFLYELLRVCHLGDNYRESLNNIVNSYTKEDIVEIVDKCEYINISFKEKIIFIYDYTAFVSEKFLKDMYMELLVIVECYIKLIGSEQFNNLMYNSSYYYSDDKRIAYIINKDNNGYNVLLKNFLYEYEESVFVGCKSEEDAIEIIRENLYIYNKGED